VTVVGVPGREVAPRKFSEKRRDAIAKKMGFDAYGATEDMPDPVANAVNRMLDHIHLLDERIDLLCVEVQRLGGEVEAKPLPVLRAEGFGRAQGDTT